MNWSDRVNPFSIAKLASVMAGHGGRESEVNLTGAAVAHHAKSYSIQIVRSQFSNLPKQPGHFPNEGICWHFERLSRCYFRWDSKPTVQ